MNIQCKSLRETSLRPRTCTIEPLESRRLLSWTTVDEFVVPAGPAGASATVLDMTSDGAGGVYASGDAYDFNTSIGTAMLRYRSATHTEWRTVATVQNSPLGVRFSDVAVAPTGEVYLSGNVGSTHMIWKGTWNAEQTALSLTVVDQDFGGTSYFESYQDLAIDAAGNVFAAAHIKRTAGPSGTKNYHWIVRKQTAGQGAFVTVDDYVFNNSNTQAKAVTVISSGANVGVYVVGRGGGSTETSAGACWIVRKSTDGGSTWSVVDGFQLEPSRNAPASAQAIATDDNGNLYVAGRASTGVQTGGTPRKPTYTYTHRWFMRSSTDGGANWSNHDVYPASAGFSSYDTTARAVTADLVGNVYVAGTVESQSIVRTNAAGAWSTSDTYGREGNAMTRDSSGAVYVAGATFGPYPPGDAIWWVRSTTPAASASSSAGGGTGGSIFADSRIADADEDRLAELV